MIEVDNKIKQAIEQINMPSKRDIFNKIYPFTTENVDGYISKFNLKNKSLLTVGSSADQVINAYYVGCKDVTLLDLNPYIEEYYDLKKAAILTLDYKDFFKFLSFEGYVFKNNKAFNDKMFKKVIAQIDNENSKEFWTKVTDNTKVSKLKKNLFMNDSYKVYETQLFNNYLENETTYQKTKKIIKNLKPTCQISNIYNYELNRNYDNIFLSNIADYNDVFKTKKLVDNLKNNLNNDGKILISYLYQTEKNSPYEEEYSKIYDLKDTLYIFDDTKIETFAGVNKLRAYNNPKDSILVYKKKKTY